MQEQARTCSEGFASERRTAATGILGETKPRNGSLRAEALARPPEHSPTGASPVPSLDVVCVLKTEETEAENETAKKALESELPEAARRPGREGVTSPQPGEVQCLHVVKTQTSPGDHRACGYCLCLSQEWSSEDFEALSRLRPSFPEGGGAAAEGSQGGPEAQAWLAASLWHLSPGREAWTSSVSFLTIPGHRPSLDPGFCLVLILVCLFGSLPCQSLALLIQSCSLGQDCGSPVGGSDL